MANETVDEIRTMLNNDKTITLTEREIKIIMIKYIIHGTSPFKDAPIELRIKMLQVAAAQYGFEYDDESWQNLGLEILKVQEMINSNAAKFLNKHSDLYKVTMRGLKEGNDALIKVIDPILENGLKNLGLKK